MCFFDTKMDFLLKKWVSTPKWVKNEKNRFLTQILVFFTHFGVRPQKWVQNDPRTPILGGRPNLIINSNGGPKKIIKFNGVHEITFLGGRKNGHFWLSNSMVFFQKIRKWWVSQWQNDQKWSFLAIFLKKSNREIQGFFFEKKVIGKSRGFFWKKSWKMTQKWSFLTHFWPPKTPPSGGVIWPPKWGSEGHFWVILTQNGMGVIFSIVMGISSNLGVKMHFLRKMTHFSKESAFLT